MIKETHAIRIADFSTIFFAIAGSTLIALNVGLDRLGYVAFLISSAASLYILKKSDGRWSIVVVTLYFMFANVVGFIRH